MKKFYRKMRKMMRMNGSATKITGLKAVMEYLALLDQVYPGIF